MTPLRLSNASPEHEPLSKRSQYVGLDVSLKETSIAVIDDAGKIAWRGTVASTPETIADVLLCRRRLPRHDAETLSVR